MVGSVVCPLAPSDTPLTVNSLAANIAQSRRNYTLQNTIHQNPLLKTHDGKIHFRKHTMEKSTLENTRWKIHFRKHTLEKSTLENIRWKNTL